MSKFKQIGGSCWVHEDLTVAFPQKSPEWIADYLVKVYELGWAHGQKHVANRIREHHDFLVEIGALPDDDKPWGPG